MLFRLILLFCAYLPFQIALNPTQGVDLASIRIFALVLFFLWLAEGLRKKKLRIKLNAVTLFVSLFLFLNLLSLFAASNSDWALRKLLFVFSFWPIYFVFSDVLDSREKWEKCFRVLVGSGLVIALIAIGQFMLQFFLGLERTYRFWAEMVAPLFLGTSFSEAVLKNPSWLVGVSGHTFLRAIAFSPDPHMLSFYLGMLAPLAVGLYFKSKRKFYLLSAICLLIADLLTFSRGGYLGLFVACVVLGLFLWKKAAQKYRLAVAGLLLVGLIALVVPSPISERFFSSFDLHEGSNQGRIETWSQAVGVAMDHPLIGVGIGNYPLAIKATADYREPIYAHSVYLDIAAETGLFSLFAWLGIMICVCYEFFKKSGPDNLYFSAALSMIIFAGHSLVETPIYSAIVLPLFLIITAYGSQREAKN